MRFEGDTSRGSLRGYTETFGRGRGRTIGWIVIPFISQKEDIRRIVANVGDANPSAVDIGEDDSPIVPTITTELFEHRSGIFKTADDGIQIAGRSRVPDFFDARFGLCGVPRRLRIRSIRSFRIPLRRFGGPRRERFPRVGTTRHQGGIAEKCVVVDLNFGS